MNLLRTACTALLVGAPLLAQVPTPRPQLHIPAGDWSVRDLLTHAEQALRTPIAAADEELAQASPERIRLQFDLALDPEHGRDALAALLATRGLLFSTDGAGHVDVKATPRGNPKWLADRAVSTTVQTVLDYPHRHSLVQVLLRTTTPTDVLTNLLRMTAATGGATPTCTATAAGTQCTGTSAAVRETILQVAAMDPAFAATLGEAPPVAIVNQAKGRAVQLTAGKHRVQDVLELLAQNGGINLVLSPAVQTLEREVDVATTMPLDWATGANTLSNLLWEQRVLVLELDVRHGIYEAVLVDTPRQMPPVARASRRTVDEALAAANCVQYVVVKFTAERLSTEQSMGIVRATMQAAAAANSSLCTVSTTTDGLRIAGLSPKVAELLQQLRAADQRRSD